MKNYILESSKESERLEQQSKNDQFKLEREISHLDFSKYKTVLDAGCGSGLLGRYLVNLYPQIKYSGCDQSQDRIAYAKEHSPSHFHFFHANLYEENFTEKSFDLIISRYVFHHLENPRLAMENLTKKLNPGGKLVIIDVDGLMVNIGTENSFLLDCLEKIKKGFSGSLNAGRRWPGMMNELHMQAISYRIDVMDFQHEDRALEVDQFKQRLEFAAPMLTEILGSPFIFDRFRKEYLSEISKKEIPFFYNRFVIEGKV